MTVTPCAGCPNWKAKPIQPRGRVEAQLVIVRDHAYGQSSNQREAGWDDESLDILDWLIDCGLHESDVVFTTLVGCPGVVRDSNLVGCASRLETLLARFEAEFVLAVGQAPALAVGIAGPVDRTRAIGYRWQRYAGRVRKVKAVQELHGANKKVRAQIEEDVRAFAMVMTRTGAFDG